MQKSNLFQETLPLLNALMIGGLVLYCYGQEVPSNIILLVGFVLTFGRSLVDRFIKWFTKEVTIKVHFLIFGIFATLWTLILLKDQSNNKYE